MFLIFRSCEGKEDILLRIWPLLAGKTLTAAAQGMQRSSLSASHCKKPVAYPDRPESF